ncbi:ArnT family glycosyltransferase [Desulfovibrio caledoniensis]
MKKSTTAFLVISLFVFSFALNLYNNGFDYHLHSDEPKKVTFIRVGSQDFMHPTFMLKLSKVIKKITRIDDEQQIAVAGRTVSAFMGACIVLATFFLALNLLPPAFALLASISVSVSPILVIHAHYLKEDVYCTAPLLFSVLFLIKAIETKKYTYLTLFGLFYGIALSSQYKSALFLVILLAVPFVDKNLPKNWYAKRLAGSLAISILTFLIINYNIFIDTANAYKGLAHEIEHIQTGHSIRFHPADYLFLFHFERSLIPGMTIAATALCTLGVFISIYRWNRSILLERVLLLCIFLFYFAHEISPLKPAPDFMRYMIPIVPMLLILGWIGIVRIYRLVYPSAGKPLGYALLLAATSALCLAPAYQTVNIVANLVDDTRLAANDFINNTGKGYVYETYGLPRFFDKEFIESAADVDIAKARGNGICLVVASSMEYDRYYYGLRSKDQNETVYRRHQAYEELFQYPYVEISPKYETFAFSNPTIRIVDICAGERDQPTSASALKATSPTRR